MPDPRRPRILVTSDGVGGLSPRAAGTALARGFAPSADMAVIGLAAGGPRLAASLTEPDGEVEKLATGWLAQAADLVAVGDASMAADPLAGSSAALGATLRYALAARPGGSLVVDLTEVDAHDAGAGLMAGLGARGNAPLDSGPASLADLDHVDLVPARSALAGLELIGVIADEQRHDQLLGLRGITARRGRAHEVDVARMLAIDAALSHLADLIDPSLADAPGAGAAGGVGFAVLALGGRLVSGPELIADRLGLPNSLSAADLVVFACDSYDFGSRGGPVLRELAGWCEDAMTPLVVVAGSVDISGREMRVMGVEAAHPLEPGPIQSALQATAQRLAAGWAGRW